MSALDLTNVYEFGSPKKFATHQIRWICPKTSQNEPNSSQT
jgi:hypothetical protein